MNSRLIVAVASALVAGSPVASQGIAVGLAVGPNFVGAATNRGSISLGDRELAGASSEGWFASVHAAWPVGAGLEFRTELFGSWLRSRDRTRVVLGRSILEPANQDRVIGLQGMLVAVPFPGSGWRPRFLLGAGPMWTRLTDPMVRADAIGLGLQTGIGVSRAVGTGRLWLELRYGHGLSAQRGSAFMPLIIGASF